jgi:predicted nucleic acid-binding protein
MSTIIIDCSYALACTMPDETRPASMTNVLKQALIAPFIWPIEVASAMRNGVRRRRLELQKARALCSHIVGLDVVLVAPAFNDPLRHFELSMTHGLTPYDAMYLDLALSRRCALATHDTELAAAAGQLGLQVLS